MAGIFSFTIDLKDKVSSGAVSAQKAIAVLSSEIRGNKEQMLGLAKGMRDGAAAMRAIESPTKEQSKLARLWLADIRDQKAELGAINQRLALHKSALLGQSKGAIASAESVGLMEAAFGSAGLAATAATVAVVAFGAAMAVAAVKVTEIAIQATEAKQRMVNLFDAMGEGRTTGAQVLDLFDELGGRIGKTKDEMAPLAESFMAMGVRGVPELRTALTAASVAFTATGERGSDALVKMMGRIEEAREQGTGLRMKVAGNPFRAMGVDIDDVSKAMGVTSAQLGSMLKNGVANADAFGAALQSAIISKGKVPLEKFSSSFSTQIKLLRENFEDLFEDIKMDSFLGAFKDLASVFDKSSTSGQILREIVKNTMGEAFTSLAGIVRSAKYWLLELMIKFLELQLFMRPVTDQVDLIKTAMYALGGAAALVGAMMGGLALMTSIAWGELLAVGAAISGVVVQAKRLWDAFTADPNLIENMISGLVDGISRGASRVADAMKSMGKAAVAALADYFQIRSPSRLMMRMGEYTAAGFSQGYEDESARAGMSGPMSVGSFSPSDFAPQAPSQASSGGRTEINVSLDVHLTGTDPKALAQELTEEAVSLVFERLSLSQGL